MSKALRRTLALVTGLLAAGLAVAYVVFEVFHVGGVNLPRAEVVAAKDRDTLDQGWPAGWGLNQAQWFHHTSQGTKILPYGWFMALERPTLSPFRGYQRFVDGDYLERFGFLPSESDARLNPDALPVGFAIQDGFLDPTDPKSKPYKVVGLTCAACHTGEIHYKDPAGGLRAARIEGGPAMTNLALFQQAVGQALVYTDLFETRYNRFADRVLGDAKSDPAERKRLRKELKSLIKTSLEVFIYSQKKGIDRLELGFARTDALGLIGNRVFGPLTNENLTVADAPVNFPHLWDTAWFDWVQYNASIRMPMVRNIGEALGVGAVINLDVPAAERYPSSVNVENLRLMEDQLGGDKPYTGLRPPRWSDTKLPPVDPAKADRGKALYRTYCQFCHLPPADELKADLASADPKFWHLDGPKIRVLHVPTFDLQRIGTDPNQALNFYRRLALVGADTDSAAKGLYNVTGFVRKTFYTSKNLTKDEVFAYDRFRPFDDPLLDAGKFDLTDEGTIGKTIVPRLAYKARPLDGIWATAPYLHNGSVPNLYQVLVPAANRDSSFTLGSKRFDPKHVGYETSHFSGGFTLDTTLSGNRNIGHEFRNLTLPELEAAKKIVPPPPLETSEPARWATALGIGLADWQALSEPQKQEKVRETTKNLLRESDFVAKGLIGPELMDAERWDLVEYLKSL